MNNTKWPLAIGAVAAVVTAAVLVAFLWPREQPQQQKQDEASTAPAAAQQQKPETQPQSQEVPAAEQQAEPSVDLDSVQPEDINNIEPSAPTDPTDPDYEPAPEPNAPNTSDAMSVVASLNGWWVGDTPTPVYVFEGTQYSEMSGNGSSEQYVYEITEGDVARLEGRGGPGWVISLGNKTLLVPDASPANPILKTDDTSIALTRGEGDLY